MSETTQHTYTEQRVHVPVSTTITLEGDLVVPPGARALVLFAHGSGSSRMSPRNRYVAHTLQEGHLATLLIDLLTPQEESVDVQTGDLRFDVDMLAERLVAATDWLADQPATRDMKIGYFGSSTGAGAALMAAAERPSSVGAVVSRGGRPDLAKLALKSVMAPTLFIVGGSDTLVISLNQMAQVQVPGETSLEIIPGASHLFEEPGALEEVTRLARQWFVRYLLHEG